MLLYCGSKWISTTRVDDPTLAHGMFLAAIIGATCAMLGTFAKRIHTAALAGATATAIPFVFLFLGSYFEYFPPTSTSRFLTLAGIVVLIGFLAGSAGGFVAHSKNRKKRVLQ
jgi:hypothetical protein